ncbi:MAG: two-component regulator propeller domain-containing protein [Bacteroidota bacterium]
MKTVVSFICALSLFLIACRRDKEKERTNPNSPQLVEAKGYIVPKDSMAEPKVITAGKPKVITAGKPVVVPANANMVRAETPEVVIAGPPEIFTPGQDSMFLQKTAPAIDKPFAAVIPEMVLVKDAYIKDNNPMNFSSFTKLQGLKNNNILCIIQDKLGNLWFGTGGGGACRYDGKYFTHFTEKEGLGNQIVHDIIQDKKGNIWFSAWGGGVFRFDGKNFTRFTEKEGLSYDVVLSMLQDNAGNIWFGTMNGSISKYDGSSFTQYKIRQGDDKCSITSIIQDRGGNIWFGTSETGVYCYDGKLFRQFTKYEGLSGNSIKWMLQDKSGNIWFGMNSGGASFYDGKSFTRFTEKEGLTNSCVQSIIQDKSGNIWFGTDGSGLILYDGKFFTHFTEKEGLGNNSVYCIFEDNSGTIWVGGNGMGVSRYNGKIFTHFTEKDGLSDKRIFSIIQDKNENLWFGSMNGGANRYDGKSFTHFTGKEGLSDNLITCIFQEENGNIWFGTYGEGVICYNGKSFSHFTEKEGLSSNWIMNVIQEKSGNIWFGTDGGGISRYDGKSFTNFTEKEGLTSLGVLNSLPDNRGNLWVGTINGLNKYDGHFFTHFTKKEGLRNDWISCIFQDKDSNIWFGVKGNGVCRFDGNSFLYLTEKEGLANNEVLSIIQDKSGNLWFGTVSGLSKLSVNYMDKLAKGSSGESAEPPVIFKNYTYEDGFLGVGCYPRSLFQDKKGTIWIGANDRLTAFHPEGGETDTTATNIQLTGIELFNEDISWSNLLNNKDTSLVLGNGVRISNIKFDSVSEWYFLPQNLSLAWNNNYLTFNFIGVTLKQSAKVKYKFKLQGLDDNWSALSSRTEAPYGNIPPGNYTFLVKAMNSEGYWSREFKYSFSIRPPWWETWWAYIAYILIVVAGIWASIYFTLEFQRRKIRLIENERNRISRELHDDIGAELSRITVISQLLQKKTNMDGDIQEKLRKISDAGKRVLGSIGEIIWTMNPQNDDLESLVAYIRRFVTEYLETNDIEVNIEFPDEIPEKAISDEYRRNVFLVVKEAIYNITKYSMATSVRLSMKLREKMVEFEISDNGTGFSVNEKQNRGNGLRNMNQRMKDIGGTFFISSEINQGTLIRISFPVH